MTDNRGENHRSPSEQVGGLAKALVIHPYFRTDRGHESEAVRAPVARLEEAVGLARAIDLFVVGEMLAPLTKRRPSTFIGKGKVEELAACVLADDIDLVIFDTDLSPVQQRNLERKLKTKVIDRTGLILEIFGERAATKEGELQVELAHLTYQRSRLVRSWTHLERQRGGVGFMGGPGETQIESDRRIISDQIAAIRRQLKTVSRTRTLHRSRRQKAPYPLVALVGYTNAGKSTLFNRLTKAEVLAADMLFATLDPTLRAIALDTGRKVILSDTVGFISDLPTHLVAAFRASLEEVISADLIIHVRDISHPDTEAQKADVLSILSDLGVTPDNEDAPTIIEALNKSDLLDKDTRTALLNKAKREPGAVPLSALTGDGMDLMMHEIDVVLGARDVTQHIALSVGEGAKISWLHRNGRVLDSRVDDEGTTHLMVRLDPIAWARFNSQE